MLTAASPPNEFVNLFHQGKRLTFNKGDFIIRPGGSPSGIFYIAKGLVKAYDITKYGDENLLIIRKAGELIGMTHAITGRQRHIIYTALAPTTVFFVESETFNSYIQEHPQAALPIIDMLTEMYRLHSERILTLEYRSVRERLVSFLLNTADRFGRELENGIMLDVPLRHQDIASSISATRETTSRELAGLERKGWLTRQQLHLVLLEPEKMRQFLE